MRSSHPSPGRRLLIAAASASLALATLATTVATADADTGSAAPPAGPVTDLAGETKHTSDNFATAKQRQRDELRQKAVAARLNGKKWAQGDVVKFPNGQSVDLSLEETDRIFTVLVEFGDQQYPNPIFQGPPPDGSTTDVTGPLHNEIPEPDRTVDNTTLWQEDYNRAHYENMYFERMREYYETQSSGRYTIDGDVTEWVKVPFNEALYGRNYCGSIVCNTSKALVRDALAMWVDAQKKAGMTIPEIYDYLKTFDVEDRYDINDNDVYDEPDGVIDHFQIVHAGGDEAAGDPNQGTDAIWSHRSGANVQAGGPLGVGVNVGSNGGLVSSSSVPNNPTGMWVYDYTVQPENGGLGVFAHEFGHDLGLPDLYDTSGNTGGAENNTAFWTLMSSGANIGDGGPDGIGDNPTDMGAWERLILGWLEPQGHERTVLRGGAVRREPRRGPRPEHAGHQEAVGAGHAAAAARAGPRGTRLGQLAVLERIRGRLRDDDDQVGHRGRSHPDHRQGALPDRDGLGLRLPGGHVQRHDLDAAGHQPVG